MTHGLEINDCNSMANVKKSVTHVTSENRVCREAQKYFQEEIKPHLEERKELTRGISRGWLFQKKREHMI